MIKLFSSAGALIDMIHATVATIHQEINGEYSCQIEADYDLQAGQIVELEDADGKQLFRLEKPVRNMELSTAFGWHITQDLAKDIITNREWSGAGADVWPDIVQAGISERRFTGTSNITTVASARMVRKSVLASMIGNHETSFLSRWGGELERDNYTVNMLNRLGADNGYEVLFGKNLTAFEATIDDSGIVNRIIPTFLGASGGTLLLPEVYIDSPRINQTPVPHCLAIHYGDIQVGAEVDEVIPYPTLASAQAEVRNRIERLYLHGADQPLLTVEIGFAELRNTEEYKDYAWLESVSLGDDVRLEYENYTVDDRVIAYNWDSLRKEYTQIVLGKMKRSLDAMTASIATQVADETAVDLQRHVTSLVLAIAELNESVANASGMFSTKINNADGSFIIYYHDAATLETSQVIEYYPEPGTRVWTDTGWNEGIPSWKYGYDQHGLLVMRLISTVGLNADWITSGQINTNLITIGEETLEDILARQSQQISQLEGGGGGNLLLNTNLGTYDNPSTYYWGWTWDGVKKRFASWDDIKNNVASWEALKNND